MHAPEGGVGGCEDGPSPEDNSRMDELPELDKYGNLRDESDGIFAELDRLHEEKKASEGRPPALSPEEIAARDAAAIEEVRASLEGPFEEDDGHEGNSPRPDA
jgi:hypothetical protein